MVPMITGIVSHPPVHQPRAGLPASGLPVSDATLDAPAGLERPARLHGADIAPEVSGLAAAPATTAPGSRFWSEAASLAAAPASASPGGPLGAVISDAARQDLASLFDSLRSRDVHLYRERVPPVSSTDKFEEMDGPQAAATVLAQPARFAAPLLVSIQAGQDASVMLPVRSLQGLQLLDAMHGLGDASALPHPSLGRALRTAADAGAEFLARPSSGRTLPVPTFFAYEILTGDEPVANGITWSHDRGSQEVRNEQEALAYAYFQGQGPSQVLANPALAEGIQQLQQAGVGFLTSDEPHQDLTGFQAWRRLSEPDAPSGAPTLTVGVAGVPCAETTAAGLVRVQRQLEPLLAVYRDTIEPSGMNDPTAAEAVRRLSTSGEPTRYAAQATLMVETWKQCLHSGFCNTLTVRDKAFALYDWMAEQAPRLDRPEEKAQALLRWTGVCGPEDARAAAEFAWHDLSQRHPDSAGYEQVAATFDHLLTRLGRLDGAQRALEVLTLPVGQASASARMGVVDHLVDLAGPELAAARKDKWRKGPDPLEEILSDYLAIAAACDGNEALEAVAGSFADLRGALTLRGRSKETRACFEFLENGRRAGLFTAKERDAAIRDFVEELVKCDSTDQARASMLAGARPRGPATVERQEDWVVVGGVRIPVKRPG